MQSKRDLKRDLQASGENPIDTMAHDEKSSILRVHGERSRCKRCARSVSPPTASAAVARTPRASWGGIGYQTPLETPSCSTVPAMRALRYAHGPLGVAVGYLKVAIGLGIKHRF